MVHYYAGLNAGKVIDIQVVADELVESEGEQAGANLLTDLFGGEWVRFSKTGDFRYNRAARGYTYDEERDAFIPPKPFDSWALDEATCLWAAPVEYPTDGLVYSWDEDTLSWVEVPGEAL